MAIERINITERLVELKSMPDAAVKAMVMFHLQQAYFAWKENKTDRGGHVLDYPTIRNWFVENGYDQSFAWYVCNGKRQMKNMADIRKLAELMVSTAVKRINLLNELLSWVK